MRILQVINIGFEAGGAEKSVRILRDGLMKAGHEVRVAASTKLMTGREEVLADYLVPVISGWPGAKAARYLWYREAHRHFRRIMAEFRPDLVHLHTIGEFSPAVLAATRGVPRILTVHGPEPWTKNLLRWNLASAADGGSLSPADRLLWLYLRGAQRTAFLPWVRGLDRVLAPSRYFAEAVRPDLGRVPVHVLPNGIEPLARPAEGAEAAGDGRAHVLYVGRLERVKGVHVLLEAYRRAVPDLPDLRLTVVGDGRERAGLESAARDLVDAGLVRFTGWLGAAEVTGHLAAAGVVVLPSLWPENFPTVALEALELGRPLVGSRVGGIPELIGPDNGALVEPGDAAALARELLRVLGDQAALAAMGRASRERSASFGVEAFLDAVLRHYKETISCAS